MDFSKPLSERSDYSVTAIITTHNRLDLLKRAIESVSAQTYDDIDLIIVDDASTDDTPQYLSSLSAEYSRISYIRISPEKSKGVNYARNAGIKAATGRLIAFLDDDDVWLPRKTAIQVEFMKKHPDIMAVSSDWIEVFIIDGKEYSFREHYFISHGKNEFFIKPYLSRTCAMMMYRSVPETVGGFDEDLPDMHDTEFSYRICAKYNVGLIKVPTFKYYHYFNVGNISASIEKYLRSEEIIRQRYAKNISEMTPDQRQRFEYNLKVNEAYRYFLLGDNRQYRKTLRRKVQMTKADKIKYFLSFFLNAKTYVKMSVYTKRLKNKLRRSNDKYPA